MSPGLYTRKVLSVFVLLISVTASVSGQIIPSELRIDWDPGISIDTVTPDGIPVYPIGTNVIDFGAKGDGITDDSDAILSAVNACPEFHAVYFPAGYYKISKTIDVSKSVVIRGEIDELTGLSRSLIYNDDIGFRFSNGYNISIIVNIESGYTKNAVQLVLSNAASFEVGDYVLIDQLNDGNLVTQIGIGGTSTWSSREEGTRCLGQLNRITGINSDTITLATPLYHTYNDTLTPEMVKLDGILEEAGIEDIHINGLYSRGSSNISMAGVSNCWIKNVHSENADRSHFSILRGYRTEIINNFIHHNRTGYGSMSYGVEFFLQSTANLVENNIFFHIHSALMIAGGLTGSVYGYNYVTEIKYIQEHILGIDCGIHGGHPNMNLIEGNVFHKFVCDSYWGSNAHITLFRNHILGHASGTTTANIAVDIQAGNKYITVVGNILGTTNFNGFYERVGVTAPYWNTWTIYKLGYNSYGDGDPEDNDPEVQKTLIRHGNFDFISDSVVWDTEIQDREIPKSLYLHSKPAFFSNLNWPPITPESGKENMLSDLPAKVRFDSIIASDTVSPEIPPDFELVSVSETAATINWDHTEDNIAFYNYEIYRDGSKVYSTIYKGPWEDKSLTGGTVYSYSIRAVDYAGNSSPPVYLSVTTPSAADTIPPSAPLNLIAITISSSQIDLTWEPSTDNVAVTGYKVFRDSIEIASIDSTCYSDTGLTDSSSFLYYVVAFDSANNESNHSEHVVAITLSDPKAYIQPPMYIDGLVIYPNPACDVLKIDMDDIRIMKVFNMQGLMVLESSENTIYVNSLPKGAYIIHIVTDDDEQHRGKIVVK